MAEARFPFPNRRVANDPDAPSRRELHGRACRLAENRRRRAEWFGDSIYGEPAWEMLLELYVSEGQTRSPVSRLAKRSGVAKATALRWLDYLQSKRLIDRDSHPTDARISYVQLTDLGRQKLEAYLCEAVIPLE